MGASITLAGESLIAQKQGAQQILTVSRFILANVPGLDPNGPVDRAAGKPAAGQIVGTYDVTDAGYVNPNQVVYSLMMGSDIGDFDWNWIGLETAENVLLMVAYVPTQQKRRNIPPLQLGNNVTRNFLVVFDGAQALTGLTIDASTWQHDFTVRLAGIDERERQSNRDIFGRACFFGSALQLEKVGAVYQLKPGTAYVEGVRLQRSAALPVVPPAFPTTAWLDVALQRELNDVVASWGVVWGAGKVDYVDSAGVQHYCVAIADLPNSNTITDSRPVENIAGPLVAHFAARVGDYAGLRARSTTKDDVGLGNLPNAKSDDENTDSSLVLATTKAVKAATSQRQPQHANLSAFSGLQGAADRLPYFTGAGALGIATFSAKAREFLAATTEAAQRALLQLGTASTVNKQADKTDTTAGALMLVGAFGIGETTSAPVVADLNSATTGGIFRYLASTPGAPLPTLGHLIVLPYAGATSHLAVDRASQRTFVRTVITSTPFTWSPWSEFHLSSNLAMTGSVQHFALSSAPAGWLKANGAAVSRATYAGLYEAIGTTFGVGDGSNTFNLPDLRGEFIRSLDDGRGIDSARGLGSAQSSAFAEHSHRIPVSMPSGTHLTDFVAKSGVTPVAVADGGALTDNGFARFTGTEMNTGGTETRPRNIALLACIKY
ncbi:phage tail protein [Stutzerimonas kunmingensis]|uniref:phage tail-collar fiber domain-containing protein n=1 Tax=Stutzerimonas kunmingensis TaxID=1211807 RepID=UPI003524DD54